MRLDRLLLLCLFMTGICSASFIHGQIYGQDLQKLNRTVITVQGAFSYQMVTDRGNYSLFLPPGQYTLSARASSPGGDLYEEKQVEIGADDQQMDLVLRPRTDVALYAGMGLLLFAVGALALYKMRGSPALQDAQLPPKQVALDDDSKSVLSALDSLEGRSTQKELKELLNFSDAKLSLILSELESMGKIRKFKRGRGNIIRKV